MAAVLEFGIQHGLIGRAQVIAWADWLIEREEAAPPDWMINLSLSHNLHVLDIVSILRKLAGETDRVAVCRAIYAFIEPPAASTFDEAEAFARYVYDITRDCVGADWTYPLLCEADQIHDDFALIRDGYLKTPRWKAIKDVGQFLENNCDGQVKALLDRCVAREASFRMGRSDG